MKYKSHLVTVPQRHVTHDGLLRVLARRHSARVTLKKGALVTRAQWDYVSASASVVLHHNCKSQRTPLFTPVAAGYFRSCGWLVCARLSSAHVSVKRTCPRAQLDKRDVMTACAGVRENIDIC
jgi:hypothetical protein